ncbi:Conserved oligomeric Golgi complex subunit 8 [Sciurus carolinensis]|uniref:Conserved oligomeric Golgi complex subunit 8 n=1 Tax=Sciurus carolinensis TaxID=30640 RepID=A0AA41MTT9_SCICA|nr:Conserved oligomeric Golgi complex subunit 8 [Sciurus carolinensis]
MAAAATLPSSSTATAAAAALGEVEDEGLLASLFRDRFPEAQWRERPDVGRYLRELSGSGLERLRREPERLAEERAQLLQQTRDLAFANYKTFIRGAECTERIHRLFGDVEASLGRLLDRLPSFQQNCRCSRPALKGFSDYDNVTKIILAFHRAEEAAFSSGEQELFVQFCTVFLEDLVPYLNRCLQVLFPPAQIAQTLGIPPTQLSKYGNLGHVNIILIQEPLAFILPKREMVFSLDDKELAPKLTASAPELPAEEPVLGSAAAACHTDEPEEMEPVESLQGKLMEGGPLLAEVPSTGS